MIIVTRMDATAAMIDRIREHVEAYGVRSHAVHQGGRVVIGCLGDAAELRSAAVAALPGVAGVTAWGTPYRLAGRPLAPDGGRTLIRIGDGARALVGGPELVVGGESGGPRHRELTPLKAEWVRDLRDEARRAGTAFFFKQWGGRRAKSRGRYLDGRTWSEYPRQLTLTRKEADSA